MWVGHGKANRRTKFCAWGGKKSKAPRKSPEKWTFLSLGFYNAPSLHIADYLSVVFCSHPMEWSLAEHCSRANTTRSQCACGCNLIVAPTYGSAGCLELPREAARLGAWFLWLSWLLGRHEFWLFPGAIASACAHFVLVGMLAKNWGSSLRQEASITWCDLFWPKFGQKMPKIISLHDVLEPSKQALLASRDVIISSQICGLKLQKVFTLGDGCWLPIFCLQLSFFACSPLRYFSDTLSHCKQRSSTVSKKAQILRKKAPTVSKKS